MIVATLLLIAVGVGVTQQPSPVAAPRPSACTDGAVQMSDVATGLLCAAEQDLVRGEGERTGSQDRTRQFEAAASGLRRAVNLSTGMDISVRALNLLAIVWQAPPSQRR